MAKRLLSKIRSDINQDGLMIRFYPNRRTQSLISCIRRVANHTIASYDRNPLRSSCTEKANAHKCKGRQKRKSSQQLNQSELDLAFLTRIRYCCFDYYLSNVSPIYLIFYEECGTKALLLSLTMNAMLHPGLRCFINSLSSNSLFSVYIKWTFSVI